MSLYYILDFDGQTPIRVDDPRSWTQWMQVHPDRRIQGGDTRVDRVTVSTVFLGINHRFGDFESPRPILWETMVFGGEYDQRTCRYASYHEAEIGHTEMCRLVFGDRDVEQTDIPIDQPKRGMKL